MIRSTRYISRAAARAAVAALALLAAACSKEEEPLFSEAVVRVRPPQGVEMVRFQATMVFENINTRQRISTSDFADGVLHLRLLRGLYRLSIAEGGGMSYRTEAAGDAQFAYVTVGNDPVQVISLRDTVDVELILNN